MEKELKPCCLRWTKEKPTVPGFYWYKINGYLKIGHVYKDEYSGNLCVSFTEEEPSDDLDTIVQGEWAGPIPAPMEAK